jgi:hypothetical protein
MFGMKENCMTLLWWTLSLRISMARVITTNSDFKNNHLQNSTVCYILLTPWGQNPRVHHRVHKSPPPIPFLSHLNPHHSQAAVPKIHSASILPSTPRSSEWSLSFGLFYQNSLRLYTSLLSHACHIPVNVIFLPNDIWGWVQITKIPIVQLPPLCCYYISLRSVYSP